MLTCALCTGEIAESSHFCPTCGAPGPAATTEERVDWRDRGAPVAATPAAGSGSASTWAPPAAPPPPPPPPPSSSWNQSQPTSPPPSGPSNPFSGWKLPAVPGVSGMVGKVAAKYVALGGAAGMILGAFLPWISADLGYAGNQTANGFDIENRGWWMIIAGLIAGLLVLANSEPIQKTVRKGLIGLGGFGVAFTLYQFGDIGETLDEASDFIDTSFSFGLFVLLFASVALIVGAVKLRTQE